MEISLRALKRSDAKRIYQLLQDKEIGQYLANIPYPYSMRDAEDFIISSINPNIKTNLTYAITLKEELIGVISLKRGKNARYHQAELGFWLGKEYRDLELTKNAINLILEEAKKDSSLDKIYVEVATPNKMSHIILEELNFKQEATIKAGLKKNDEFIDIHYFSHFL